MAEIHACVYCDSAAVAAYNTSVQFSEEKI